MVGVSNGACSNHRFSVRKKVDEKQLLFEFMAAGARLQAAVSDFLEVAQRLQEAAPPANQSGIRATARRLVGILVDQSGLPFHVAWVMAYHEHYLRTGFHAAAKNQSAGTHLDVVEEAGQLPEFVKTVRGMLISKDYRKTA